MGRRMKERLSLRVEEERLKKLRRIAKKRKKTMTQLIEEWIDRMKDEPDL
jgi:predicted DNA-binding ribbon-helix-helix protein